MPGRVVAPGQGLHPVDIAGWAGSEYHRYLDCLQGKQVLDDFDAWKVDERLLLTGRSIGLFKGNAYYRIHGERAD